MQPWQIKALGLEQLVLKFLDRVITDNGTSIFIGLVFLLIPFLAWVLSGGLRRKLLKGKPMPDVPPVVTIQLPGRSPQSSEVFDPFPLLSDPPDCDQDEQ